MQTYSHAILLLSMLVQTTNSMRVAVLGSGVAGSTAARTLADRVPGIQVTVFEAGFGIGGRTSTRITRDKSRYQFDHGAQYIGSPKTNVFRDTLEQWKSDGWVKEWKGGGRFVSVDGMEVKEEEKKERFVGYPGMHSICRNLLHHENIRVKLQTRAHASASDDGNGWDLVNTKNKKHLGNFDWLIVSDRNSGSRNRKDLVNADVSEYQSGVRSIKSVKSLTAMVAFERHLDLNINAVQFSGKDERYGSLGWVARDSSKPGRERDDGHDCWVLQSHPDAAKKLLKGKYKVNEIREMAKDVLVRDFLKSIPHLMGVDEDVDSVEHPPIATAIGHRWGAAFPIPTKKIMDMESQVISSKKFAACGDYYGKLSGRIEGAFLSGRSAANEIASLCDDI